MEILLNLSRRLFLECLFSASALFFFPFLSFFLANKSPDQFSSTLLFAISVFPDSFTDSVALFLSCPSSSFCDLCWQFLSSERSACLFLRSELLLPTNRLVVTGLGREPIGLAARRATSVREGGGENTGEPVALTLCLSLCVWRVAERITLTLPKRLLGILCLGKLLFPCCSY